ncbi:MAG: hypothetical protein ACD_63C00135G0006, partial [uncultured bacterium]
DATQGIQAQTLANVYMAIEQDLTIIPIINKIDLPNADPAKVARELVKVLGVSENDIILASAKTGEGVPEILDAVVKRIPQPEGKAEAPLRALIFDSRYDSYRGVEAFVRVVDGEIKKDDEISFVATGKNGTVFDTGIFKPKLISTQVLKTGEVGYVDTGLKNIEGVRVGDTITKMTNEYQSPNVKSGVEPLPGYKEPKPVVFAGVYPVNGDDYPILKDAISKLKLNDAALTYEPEKAGPLGFGYRCGFLGLLHLDIVQERLRREFNLNLVVTAPSVTYKVKVRSQFHRGEIKFKSSSPVYTEASSGGEKLQVKTIYVPSQLPADYEKILEPWTKVEIVTPSEYVGKVMELAHGRRGKYKTTEYLGEDRAIVTYEMPLSDIIIDFYDKLKSVSSGYASMSYELLDYKAWDLVKLDFLINKEKFDALSMIVPRKDAVKIGRTNVKKLKKFIPKHMFQVPLQAAIGGDVIARETIPAFRKDVTAKLYGGDVTRKTKLLDKQKKGKKKMQSIGNVSVPQKVFLEIMKR